MLGRLQKQSERGIAFTRTKDTQEGIRIQPAVVKDLRNLTALLDEIDVEDDIRQKGLPVISVRTIHKQGKPLSLVFVNLTRTKSAKTIYQIKRCCSLHGRVESPRQRRYKVQCYKCQRFGHAQSR